MTTPISSKRPPWLRRLFAGDRALVALAFVANGDKPSAPNSTEASGRVRALTRDDAGPTMETVWSNDDYVITSRYHVEGQHVSPVSRQTWGYRREASGLPRQDRQLKWIASA